MKPTTIVIALPLEDDQLDTILSWARDFEWIHVKSVHFIHVVKQTIMTMEFGYIETPDEKAFQEMRPQLEIYMEEAATKILPVGFGGEVLYSLERSFSPEETIKNYIDRVHADTLVIGTRDKHGFSSWLDPSFAAHMVKHAHCDVFVAKPEH